MFSGSESTTESSVGARKRRNWSSAASSTHSSIWPRSTSSLFESPETGPGTRQRARDDRKRDNATWVPSMQNNTFAYDTDVESYMPGDGLKYLSEISDVESSEIEMPRDQQRPSIPSFRNPNHNKLKNPPKEKNMAEFGWGHLHEVEDPFWEGIRRQNKREREFRIQRSPLSAQEPPRLLKIRGIDNSFTSHI
ncbi:Oidioi.mRNA.OKI2018_I69.XSR.g15860.t1.cds [Oikopleura dioica]|uniref:Oidioi.mRNA.OKI2018_I69.XSR.g15860.t1.cds n=1 Tax=Oikopleura dioica TaxID=34765 RepID=A0ABN7SE76_OIKDI|nr:Oidioi.mRNA.OKI2018_I69.XSR.g15860.t1.cds [Oikopleura dioica]